MAEEVKRKRQARGEARIQSLLLAAESVFARVGYTKATTNEIADEAAVSPATLYQFFKNKEEIANAVALKYMEAMVQQYDSVDYKTMSKLPMRAMVEKLIFPLFDFHEKNPAFMALLVDAPLSKDTYERKLAMSANFVRCLSQILELRNPMLSAKDASYHAEVAMLLFKGFVGEINGANGKRKKMLLDTLVDLMVSQLSRAA